MNPGMEVLKELIVGLGYVMISLICGRGSLMAIGKGGYSVNGFDLASLLSEP